MGFKWWGECCVRAVASKGFRLLNGRSSLGDGDSVVVDREMLRGKHTSTDGAFTHAWSELRKSESLVLWSHHRRGPESEIDGSETFEDHH